MIELELLESKDEREKYIDRIEVLDKVKEVILLPYGDCMTTEQVAEYYEIPKSTIDALVFDNKEELIENGYETLTKDELTCFKKVCEIKSRARQISIFTRRTILNVGMLLRDSKVAKEVRSRLLDMSENKENIRETINDIDEEDILTLKVLHSKTESERLIALSNLTRFKDEKEEKIKKERDIAVKKVENLTTSDATFGIREAKNNLNVGEKKLISYLIENKYCYRQHKNGDEKNNPTGKLKAYGEFTQEPNRYFTEIVQVDRIGNNHTKTVFTIEGIEYFRKLKDKIAN